MAKEPDVQISAVELLSSVKRKRYLISEPTAGKKICTTEGSLNTRLKDILTYPNQQKYTSAGSTDICMSLASTFSGDKHN